jgi:hypothetical protein
MQRPLTLLTIVLWGLTSLAMSPSTLADTLKNEEEVRQLVDKVMTVAGQGQTDNAYGTLTAYALMDINLLERQRINSRTTRMQLEPIVGQSVGYEFIRSEKVGDSLLKLVYIEKTEKQAVPWQFIFYKTPAGWALSSLNNQADLNVLFSR